MKISISSYYAGFAALICFTTLAHAAPDLSTFEGRRTALRELALQQVVKHDAFPPGGGELAAFKLSVDPNDKETKKLLFGILQLRPITKNFTFFPQAVMHAYLVGKKAYSQEERDIFRKYFEAADYKRDEFVPSYAGRVLNYASVHLMCQEWPDLRDRGGNRCSGADGLAAAARENLQNALVDSFAGNGDRGSFTYDGFIMSSFRMVATFSRDPQMSQAATSAYLGRMVDLALSWNNGLLTSTAHREKGFSIYGPAHPAGSYQLAWLLFGAKNQKAPELEKIDTRFLYDSPLDSRTPAALIRAAEQNRHGMTYYSRAEHMYRTFFHSANYSLVSAAIGGWKWNTWNDGSTTDNLLKWRMPTNQQASTVATFRLGNENATHGRPTPRTDGKPTEMARYGEGRSPYSRVFQHERTLIGLSNSPKFDKFDDNDTRGPVIFKAQYAMFPNDGSLVEPLKFVGQRWIFANAGATFFAVYFPKKYFVSNANYKPSEESDRSYTIIRSDKRRNGWVLETTDSSKYAQAGAANKDRFAAFVRDVLENAKVDQSRLDDRRPSLSYTSIHGYTMKFIYDPSPENLASKIRFVNGRLVDHSDFPVFETQSKKGRRKTVDVRQTYVKPEFDAAVRRQKPLAKLMLTPSRDIAATAPKAVIDPPK